MFNKEGQGTGSRSHFQATAPLRWPCRSPRLLSARRPSFQSRHAASRPICAVHDPKPQGRNPPASSTPSTERPPAPGSPVCQRSDPFAQSTTASQTLPLPLASCRQDTGVSMGMRDSFALSSPVVQFLPMSGTVLSLFFPTLLSSLSGSLARLQPRSVAIAHDAHVADCVSSNLPLPAATGSGGTRHRATDGRS